MEETPGVGNEDEKKENEEMQPKPLLDIVFVLDCTGSMSSYIQACKDNINQISSTIHKETNNEYLIQFGLVLYRDIPPQDLTFITKRIDFTPIPLQIQLKLNSVRATGGGDTPEALTSALYDCYKNLKWREHSIKVIVVITDAPPHGLETQVQDGFPDGDPNTFDDDDVELQEEGVDDVDNKNPNKFLNVIEIITSIRDELNASIYSVACEPSLSCNNDYANDFMQYMSEFTDGKFLPLSNASLLPKVIIGSIKQQINLDDLAFKLDEEIKKIKAKYGNDISDDKVNQLIAEKWKEEGIEKKEIAVSEIYKNKRSRENVELLMNQQIVKSLADFKQKCKLLPRMDRTEFTHCGGDGSGHSTRGGSGDTYRRGRGGRGGIARPVRREYRPIGRGRGRGRGGRGRGGRGRGRGRRARGRARGGSAIANKMSEPCSKRLSAEVSSLNRKQMSKQKVEMRGGMSSRDVDRIRRYRGRGGGRGRGRGRGRRR
eukprot:506253_1